MAVLAAWCAVALTGLSVLMYRTVKWIING